MTPTIDIIEQTFNEWNEKAFWNQLPKPKFNIRNTRRSLGSFQCTRIPYVNKPMNCAITISKYFDLSQDMFIDAMLHEMIHYYLAINGKFCNHDLDFIIQMDRINSNFGRNVTITNEEKLKSIQGLPMLYAFAVLLKDGRVGYSVYKYNRTDVNVIKKQFNDWNEVKEYWVFLTNDDAFSTSPVQRMKNYISVNVWEKDRFLETTQRLVDNGCLIE